MATNVQGKNPAGENALNTNPVLIGAKDANGKAVMLQVDADGLLRVASDISSVTATDITVHDPTTTANKLKVNADGTIGVSLSGSKAQVKVINASSSNIIAAGQLEHIDIVPTTGYKAKLISIELSVISPTGATTDTHAVYIKSGTTTSIVHAKITAAYNKLMSFSCGAAINADTIITPSDVAAFNDIIHSIEFSALTPLRLSWLNSTDVSQTNTRNIFVCYTEEAII